MEASYVKVFVKGKLQTIMGVVKVKLHIIKGVDTHGYRRILVKDAYSKPIDKDGPKRNNETL